MRFILFTLAALVATAVAPSSYAAVVIKQQDPAPTSVTFANNSGTKLQVLNVGSTLTASLSPAVFAVRPVGANNTFYLTHLDVIVTGAAASNINGGDFYLEGPVGTVIVTGSAMLNNGIARYTYDFTEPVTASAGVVMDVHVAPGAVNSLQWRANVIGYEK